MTLAMDHELTLLIFLPLLGALVVGASPGRRPGLARGLALAFGGGELLVALHLFLRFDSQANGMQFVERYAWIPALGVHFHAGIDGLSLFLVLLTVLVVPLSLIATWPGPGRGVKGFVGALLLLEGAAVGVFAALDLFMFCMFCELTLLPMFVLIGAWGGERRAPVATKFALYTLSGSLLLLLGTVFLADCRRELEGALHFGLQELSQLPLPLEVQQWLLLAFFAGFAIKMSLVPLHTWLSEAQAQAPTAAGAVMVAVLLNVGGYGVVRLCLPLFPQAFSRFSDHLATVAVVGILYAGLVALANADLKRLVACLSAGQAGLILLGICALGIEGLQGSMLHMVSCGLSTGALVLMAGLLSDRAGTSLIGRGAGLAREIPVFSVCFLIAILAAVGMPGTSGFIGELLVLRGSFEAFGNRTAVALVGLVLLAICLLGVFRRAMWGPGRAAASRRLPDLKPRELAALLPLLLLAVGIGVWPGPVVSRMEPSAAHVLVQAGPGEALSTPGPIEPGADSTGERP